MSSLLSKGKKDSNSNCCGSVETTEENDEGKLQVTTHLYLKPYGTVDKAVVLRRIRHRKRANKVRSAVQTLLSSPFASDNKTSVTQIRWADDAFAAP
ncbi:hypothetical protein ACS0TY_024275 [Phlomoides rotata]